MSDPKYFARGDKMYHEDGYELPSDEPLMVFRGQGYRVFRCYL